MTGWREVALGEICEFRYGRALAASQRDGVGFPVYGSNGAVGMHSKTLTSGPTIIIGRKGSYGEVNYSPTGCWPIDTSYYIDSTSTGADLRWLFHRLARLRLTELNRAAAVPGLNREDAYRQRLLVPPVEEQRRIAAILDQADAIRAKRRQVLAHLDTLTQSVFHAMFGDPATNPRGLPKRSLGALSAKFSDGPFGSNLKSEHYTAAGVRVIRLQNIGVGRMLSNDVAFVSNDHFESLGKHRCEPGDVLIGTLGEPNLRACIQPITLPEALNKADCVQMRVDPTVATPEWSCWLLNSPGTLAAASALAHGQTRTRIAMGQLRRLEVPVPRLEEQREFAAKVEAINVQHTAVERALALDDELFASLQSRAFRGEL